MNKILLKRWLLLLLSLVVLCLPTIINAYPILYSDTSTYIASGFELETPADRPITYGLLLRIFSLNGLSLLFVPLFQSLLVIITLRQVAMLLFPSELPGKHVLMVSIGIVLLTTYSWSVNELIADYLCPLGLLALFVLLYQENPPQRQTGLFVIFFIASAAHLSNWFLYAGLILFVLIFRRRILGRVDRKLTNIRLGVLGSVMLVSFLIMMSALSKGGPIHFAGSLAHKGILQKILHDRCGEANFRLCAYKDSIPEAFEDFVWKEKSPLYRLGGWKQMREELRTIRDISYEPEYFGLQLKKTALFSIKQLGMWEMGEGNGSFGRQTQLVQRIGYYIPRDHPLNSLQFQGQTNPMPNLNAYFQISVSVVIFAFLLLFVVYYRKMSDPVRTLFLFTVLLIIGNAILTAYTSEPSHRIGAKLYWLLFLNIYVVVAAGRTGKPEWGGRTGNGSYL